MHILKSISNININITIIDNIENIRRNTLSVIRFESRRNLFNLSMAFPKKNSMPICNILDKRKILLLKSCLECDSNIIRLCAFLRLNDNNVIDVSLKYYVHCHMCRPVIKSVIRSVFFNGLRGEGLLLFVVLFVLLGLFLLYPVLFI